MLKKLVFVILAIVVVCASCEDRDDNITTVKLRIFNKSTLNINELKVGRDTLLFTGIPADTRTEYLEFDTLFRQSVLEIATDSAVFRFEPVGDFEPLPIGLYTYEVDILDSGEVSLDFNVDY